MPTSNQTNRAILVDCTLINMRIILSRRKKRHTTPNVHRSIQPCQCVFKTYSFLFYVHQHHNHTRARKHAHKQRAKKNGTFLLDVSAADSQLSLPLQIEDGDVGVSRRAAPLHRRCERRHTAPLWATTIASRSENHTRRGTYQSLQWWAGLFICPSSDVRPAIAINANAMYRILLVDPYAEVT